MKFPKLPRRPAASECEDRAVAFWAAANEFGRNTFGTDFAGDLSPFGFRETNKTRDVDTIRDAYVTMYPYFPQQGRFQGFPAEDRVKHAKANFASYQKDPRTTLWRHSKEKSFALTRPYLHRAPTGDSLLILISREHMKDGKARPARNDKMGGLEIAQPRQLTEPQYVGDYAYATKRSLGFQFTQKYSSPARDGVSLCSYGLALDPNFPEDDPHPKLYLEMEFNDRYL